MPSIWRSISGASSDTVVKVLPCFYDWQAAHDYCFVGTQPLFGKVSPS